MRVLWINPSFLDYRVPLYSNIFELMDKDFYVLYSKSRIPQRITDKMELAMGDHAVGLVNEKKIFIGKKTDFANKHISLPYQKGLYKAIKSINPDLIIAEGFFQWTPWALLYSRFHKVPLFISYERTEHTERNCPQWRLLYRKLISKYTTGFLVNGNLTLSYLRKNRMDENKIIISGCMCADSKSLSDKLRLITKEDNESFLESLKINRGKGLIFLFVGQIIERKGVLELLKAWQKYIRIFDHDCLLLVGNGTLLPVYQKLYPDSENLKFIGDVDYSLIQNYYSIADVFIMPTLEDNWSLVVPEAMSCGLPIATSIYNGCYPELVTEKNGLVFDPLNEQSINGALEYFHRPDINLQSMGEASVQIEKEFSPERAASKIVNGLKRE